MKEDAKADEMVEGLREAFAQQIRKAVAELPAHMALQLADSLCAVQLDVLAGLRVHYRTRPVVDGEAIAEDWRLGRSLREIVDRHKCSRSAAYQHHPNRKIAAAKGG